MDIIYSSALESSELYVKTEQHFWYCGDCNLEDYMQLNFTTFSGSDAFYTKFKYKYLIPSVPLVVSNSLKHIADQGILYNGAPWDNIIIQYSSLSAGSTFYNMNRFQITLANPSQISGILMLKMDNKQYIEQVASSYSASCMLIKVTKGSTEVIPIQGDTVTVSGSQLKIVPIVQNVYD